MVNIKMANCNICGEEFSRPDSLSRNLEQKNSCVEKNSIVGHQNICSVPDKSKTVMGTDVKRQYGIATIFPEQSVQNQLHKKALNPKISAFANAIIDEKPSSKDKPTTFLESLSIPPAPKKSDKLFSVKKTPPRIDLSAKVDDDITDTDDDDIDDQPPPKQNEGQMNLTDNETEDEEDDSDEDDDDKDDDDEMLDPVSDPEEVLAKKIKETVEYLIRHDKEEIEELLKKFPDYDENYENSFISTCRDMDRKKSGN